jgi:ubiquitin-conjugating enzyme E2 G2
MNPPDGITAGPVNEDNFLLWEAVISYLHFSISSAGYQYVYMIHFVSVRGPSDTPYEGGLFTAQLQFPTDYPLNPPSMRFTCDVFHPNGTSLQIYSIKCKYNFILLK